MNWSILYKDQEYLLMIAFVLVAVGLIKDHMLFNSTFYYIKQVVKSNKILVAILSAIGGLLPISGRVTVSAGMLDTIAPKPGQPGREKYGVIDYLSTHHYYIWSPLEKTVLVPMAAFGLSWLAVMQLLWPLLLVTLIVIFGYIFYYVKEEDVIITPIIDFDFKISDVVRNLVPMIATIAAVINGYSAIWAFGLLVFYYCLLTKTWNLKQLLGYINWEIIIVVAVVIVFGNYVKLYDSEIAQLIKTSSFNFSTITGTIYLSLIALGSGLLLGSSSRFAAFTVLLTQIYGLEYFIWFFALEYAGYLLSPAHKCMAVGKTYFNTPIVQYLTILLVWSLILILTAGLVVFIL